MIVNGEEYAIRPAGLSDGIRDRADSIEQALSERIARREARSISVPTPDVRRVTLRLPLAVIDHFMAKGTDWRERLVEVIEREMERTDER